MNWREKQLGDVPVQNCRLSKYGGFHRQLCISPHCYTLSMLSEDVNMVKTLYLVDLFGKSFGALTKMAIEI